MRKGQQQIRCSSDVSIAGRTDSRLQVKSVFIPVLSSPLPNPLSLTKSLSMSSCTHRLMDFWSCALTPTLVSFPHRIQLRLQRNSCWCSVSLWFQIQARPPRKTRDPRDRQQGRAPGTEKSGGDEAARFPHEGDTGTSLQGKTLDNIYTLF